MKTVLSLALALSLLALSPRVIAIDLQPNDIVAPAPGITAVTVSYINSQNNNFYLNGLATGGSPNLENNSALFRLGHTYTIAGLPAVTYVQTGVGILSPDGSIASYPGSKGMTDTTIATAVWPYANSVTRTYFGVAAYASLPTGE